MHHFSVESLNLAASFRMLGEGGCELVVARQSNRETFLQKLTKWPQTRSRKMVQPTGIIEFIQKAWGKWRTVEVVLLLIPAPNYC